MDQTYPVGMNAVVDLLVRLVREGCGQALAKRPQDLDLVVRDVLREVGRRTTEMIAADVAACAVQTARAEGFLVERSPMITFTTVFGPVGVKSPYMRDGRRGRRPVNATLQVHGNGMTRGLERALCDFGVDASFERASLKLKEHYGLDVHRTTVLRVVTKHGADAELNSSMRGLAAMDSRPPNHPPGPPMLAEMDGSCVRTGVLEPLANGAKTAKRGLPARKRTTEWRDLRLAFIRPLATDDCTDQEGAVVGGIHDFRLITARLLAEAHDLGWSEPTFTVRVTDGGQGVREALDAIFPTGQHVLDKPHFLHHLHEAAEAVSGSDQAKAKLVDDWNHRISAGGVDAVIRELQQLRGPGAERAQQLANYLQRFRDSVHYDRFVNDGIPIGSGEIESAHKGEVQTRMKLPGTWWTTRNANRVLALRLLRTNRRWDSYWVNNAAA